MPWSPDPALKSEIEQRAGRSFSQNAPMPLEFLRSGVEEPSPARANAWRACIEFSTKDRLAELSVSGTGAARHRRSG